MSDLPSVLFCCPIPPPTTGQAFISKHLIKGYKGKKNIVNQNFEGKPAYTKIILTLISLLKILHILVTKKNDIVYITCSRSITGSIKDVWVLLLSSYIFKKKIIVHLHGSDFKSFYQKQNKAVKFIFRKLYSNIDIAIVLCEEMKEQFDIIENLNVRYLYNFYDPLLDEEAGRSKISNKITLSYFSNVMFSKGVFLAIDAFKKLKKILPELELQIAGKIMGDEFLTENDIKTKFFNEIENESSIKYFGQLESKEKVSFLKSSDILIFPSFYVSEAFAVSVIEAMRAGNAIITSRQGYHHTIIGPENGIVLQDLKIESIVDALFQIVSNKELLVSMQKLNVLKATSGFSLSQFKSNFESILNDLSLAKK